MRRPTPIRSTLWVCKCSTGSDAQYGKEDRPTMDGSKERPKVTAGLDLGDKYSYLCLIDTQSGEVIEEGRLRTTPENYLRPPTTRQLPPHQANLRSPLRGLATTSMMPPGVVWRIDWRLFTGVHGRGVLRTSHVSDSPKFGCRSCIDRPASTDKLTSVRVRRNDRY
jgi:hypothetical protein